MIAVNLESGKLYHDAELKAHLASLTTVRQMDQEEYKD